MDTEQLIETLEEAGLSPYQADAYVTILEVGAASATDIAHASSVPDPRIYDVLRDLEEKEYIETYKQGSLHARAHDPAGVLADLESRASQLETAAEEIEHRWNSPDIEDHNVSVVKRLETVLSRTEELIDGATDQVKIALTPAQFTQLAPRLEQAYERGVNVKLCLSGVSNEVTLPAETTLERTCSEARYRELPSPFMALIDRSWACVSPHGRSTNRYSIIINDNTYAYVFHWYFLTALWEFHEVLYSDRREEGPITYVDLRQCVRDLEPLLSEGVSIEATVHGYDTDTGREMTVQGRVIDAISAGVSTSPEESTPVSDLAGKVSIVLETDDGTYTVGGWGALVEDIEAIRITIDPESPPK